MSKSVLSIGIIGLPNVGKSTLFNALLRREVALAANYPFATIEPNIGIVEVPDPRLPELAQIVETDHHRPPEKIIYSTIKFVDIAGLIEGAHQGEGLGNKFLSHIREVDAIAHVIRVFEDEDVARVGGKAGSADPQTDPQSDIEIIKTELILADLQTIEKHLSKAKPNSSKEEQLRVKTISEIHDRLGQGMTVDDMNLSGEKLVQIKDLHLLTQKKVIFVFNMAENGINKGSENGKNPQFFPSFPNSVVMSAKLEAQLSSLSSEDQKIYLQDLGLTESGLDQLIQKSFETLNLHTFLTAGPKEVRAWTIKRGAKAPQAAGTIHTDFERGFIAAEVISFENLQKCGSFKTAREKGLLRIEGKNYVMRSGDVVEFRFSV